MARKKKIWPWVAAIGTALAALGGLLWWRRRQEPPVVTTEEQGGTEQLFAWFPPGSNGVKTSTGPSTQAHSPWEDEPEQGLPTTAQQFGTVTGKGGGTQLAPGEKKTVDFTFNQNTVSTICWHPDWEKESSVSQEMKDSLVGFPSDCKEITLDSSYDFVTSMIKQTGSEGNWDLGLWPDGWPRTQTFHIERPNGQRIKTFQMTFKTGYPSTKSFKLEPGYYVLRRGKGTLSWSLDSDLAWQDKETWKTRYSLLYVAFHYFPTAYEATVPEITTKPGGWAFYVTPQKGRQILWLSAGLFVKLSNVAGNKGAVAKIEDLGMDSAQTAMDKIKEFFGV